MDKRTGGQADRKGFQRNNSRIVDNFSGNWVDFFSTDGLSRKPIMGTHKELEVWKNSMRLTIDVYQKTNGFPKHEQFGLTSQIRRAAVSVPANISEGSARLRPKEFAYFLRISFASLSELETLLMISTELCYLTRDEYELLNKKIILITSQLSRLIYAIQKKIQSQPTN